MNMDAVLKITTKVEGENNIRRLGNSMQGLQGQVKNTSMAVAGLGAAFKGLGAALAVGGFATAIKGAIDLADDMRDLSQRTGVGIETLGQFKVAAELSGTSLEGVANGLKLLNKNMVAAATGGEGAAAAFKTIGVATTEVDGTLRKADQVFLDVADKFKSLRDGPEKAALALKIFGKSGTDLIPILNLGSKEIQRFGLGIGPDFANKADAFNDSLGIMKAQVTVLTVQIGSALLPVLSGLVTVVAQGVTFVGNLAAEFYKAIGGAAGLQQAAAFLAKTMFVVGVASAGAFSAKAVIAFASAIRALIPLLNFIALKEKAIVAYKAAQASLSATIAALQTPGEGRAKAIGAIVAGTIGTAALVAGVGKLIDDLTKRMGEGLQDALRMPNIPNPPPGTTPDISALRTGDGGKQKAKDEAARRKEALLASQNALRQARGELAVERELDPMRKIQLEYAEKRRALIAASDKALRNALSGEEQANIQRTRSVQLQQVQVQETNALTEAFKQLAGAGFEAGMSGELFYISIEKTTSAMQDFNLGITGYLESIGTLGANLSNLAQSGFKGLEDAIVSMTTTGTFNFQQFALSIVEETTRMVTRLLVIAPMLSFIQSLLPGGGGGGGLGGLFKSLGGLNSSVGFGSGITGFASGGIVNRPTMFAFANGGTGQFGLMGEAGPEAIMPLRRGRDGRLGVQSAGGGAVNVTVNVDASGTQAQGNNPKANAFGKAISAAVQAEIIRQKRPGGALS